jgi:uncharacterized protein (DUF697 family)
MPSGSSRQPLARSVDVLKYWDALNKAIEGGFDGATEVEKTRAVEEAIRVASSGAAILALQPVALVDSAIITPLQIRMVRGIARIRGCRDSGVAVKKIYGSILGGLVGPHLTMAGAKLIPIIPVLPDLVAVSVAYALTHAIGELSDCYFLTSPPPQDHEVRSRFDALYRRRFERTYREKRDEMTAMFRQSPEVRRKLRELKRERRTGAINEEEALRRAEELVRGAAPRG